MVNLNLLKKEFREYRWTLIIGTVILTGMGVFTPFSFKFMTLYGDKVAEYFSPELAEQFNQMLENFSYYLWTQWHPKNLLQVGTVLALILSSSAIAGEVNRGSIKYLTSLPVSRTTILISKALAGGVILTAIVWFSTLAMLFSAYMLQPVQWGRMLAATALVNTGLLAVYAVGLLFSAWGSDSVKAGALAAAALFLWSAAGLFPATKVFSPFWHMKGSAWFSGAASFPWLSLGVLAVLTGISIAAAGRVFSRREI